MAKSNLLRKRRLPIYIGTIISIAAGLAVGSLFYDFGPGVALKLDREDLDLHGKPINPSTQSINRYASVLRDLDRLLKIDFNHEKKQINFELGSTNYDQKAFLKNNVNVTLPQNEKH